MNKLQIFCLIVLATTLVSQLNAQNPEEGDKAPLFTATNDHGEKWLLKDHLGSNYIVLFFYPAAMTGGCTKQACAFRDNAKAFEEEGAVVAGISGDDVENLPLFKEAHGLNFDLLSDPKGEIAKSYGVPLRDGGSLVRTINGKDFTLNREVTTARWTFVINKEGEIIYKNTDVKVEEDPANVLAAIKTDKN
ncbi:MAG: peroxiredoxin [Cyclobacteriaceae bacterium]